MKLGAVEQLCSYTATQIGWTNAPHFTTLKATPGGFPVIDTNNMLTTLATPVSLPWAYGQNILLGERERWSSDGQEYTFSGWSNGSAWTNILGTEDGLPSSKLLDVIFDGDSTLWVAGINGVAGKDTAGRIRTFTPDNGFPDDGAAALALSPDGGIWAVGNAISVYGGVNWTNFQPPSGFTDHFLDIFFDTQGRMWVGSLFGVAYYDSLWHTFTTQDGLTNNEASAIAEDRQGNIWVGTTSGINRWDGAQWQQFATFNGAAIPFVQDIFVEPASGFSIVIISDRGLLCAQSSALVFDAFGVAGPHAASRHASALEGA